MISREAGRKIYRDKRKRAIEVRKSESCYQEEKRVKTKLRSQGINLNDLVQLRSPIRHGYVRWIGKINGLNDDCEFFGIALKGRYRKLGKHNGSFRGVKYFTANDKAGLFCKREKIEKTLRRSTLSVIENALTQLPETEDTKITTFAENVRRLTRLLSIGNLNGLDMTFERARKKSMFKYQKTPFTLAEIPSDLLQIEESNGSLEVSPSNSCTYGEESAMHVANLEGVENEEFKTSKPGSGSIKDVDSFEKFPSKGTEEKKPTDREFKVERKSRFLKISMRNDTLGEIMCSELSNDYSQALKEELEEDYSLFAVSQKTLNGLKSRQDVKELITNLQICINVLKKHIPKVTEVLDVSDNNNTVYMTNVIQDLLKRAQDEKLSNKILTDFSGIRKLDYFCAYTPADVSALVDTMAWVRNNLCIAGLTDENDAKMTLMGAEEVQQSLVGILKRLDKKKPKTLMLSLKDIDQSGVFSKTESECLTEHSDYHTLELNNIATSTLL